MKVRVPFSQKGKIKTSWNKSEPWTVLKNNYYDPEITKSSITYFSLMYVSDVCYLTCVNVQVNIRSIDFRYVT